MKKLFVLLFAISLVIFSSVAAYGFSAPTVTEDQWNFMGVITTTPGSAMVGAEYGISPEMAVVAELGAGDFSKIGVIYELQSNLALTGGISGTGGFIGVIGSMPVGKTLLGIGQLDLKIMNDQVGFMYEAGVRYGFKKQWDLRGGLIGAEVNGDNVIGFAFGAGYRM